MFSLHSVRKKIDTVFFQQLQEKKITDFPLSVPSNIKDNDRNEAAVLVIKSKDENKNISADYDTYNNRKALLGGHCA